MAWHWCWLWWGWGARSRTRSSQELLCGSHSGFSRAPSSRKPLLRSQGKASAMVAHRSSHQRTSHHRHQQRDEPSWRGRRTRQSFPCSGLPGPSPFLEALWGIALRRQELKLCLPSKWMNCTQICLYMHRKNATQLEWFNQVFIVLLLFHAKNKVKWVFRSLLFLFPCVRSSSAGGDTFLRPGMMAESAINFWLSFSLRFRSAMMCSWAWDSVARWRSVPCRCLEPPGAQTLIPSFIFTALPGTLSLCGLGLGNRRDGRDEPPGSIFPVPGEKSQLMISWLILDPATNPGLLTGRKGGEVWLSEERDCGIKPLPGAGAACGMSWLGDAISHWRRKLDSSIPCRLWFLLMQKFVQSIDACMQFQRGRWQ